MYLLICILVMALITYGTRVFPFVFLKDKIYSLLYALFSTWGYDLSKCVL